MISESIGGPTSYNREFTPLLYKI